MISTVPRPWHDWHVFVPCVVAADKIKSVPTLLPASTSTSEAASALHAIVSSLKICSVISVFVMSALCSPASAPCARGGSLVVACVCGRRVSRSCLRCMPARTADPVESRYARLFFRQLARNGPRSVYMSSVIASCAVIATAPSSYLPLYSSTRVRNSARPSRWSSTLTRWSLAPPRVLMRGWWRGVVEVLLCHCLQMLVGRSIFVLSFLCLVLPVIVAQRCGRAV